MSQPNEFDIAVVGGGPAGSKTAQKAAQAGAKVLLVEAKKEVGKPIKCAGIITKRAFQVSDLPNSQIIRSIKGAKVFSSGKKRLEFKTETPRSDVINRANFDQALLKKAEKAGATIKRSTEAYDFEYPYLKVQKDGKSSKIKTKILIGADGPQSKTREWLGLPSPPRKIHGNQVKIKTKKDLDSLVNLYFNNDHFRDFFGWTIPTEENRARVGLGTTEPKALKESLQYILKNYHPQAEIIKRQGGIIPIGFSKQTYTKGGLIVGDAAGQVKPTSGGGIFTGLSCAKIAGRTAAKKAKKDKIKASDLAEYEKKWKEKLERELRFGYFVSKVWKHSPNFLISHLLGTLNEEKIKEKIKKYGDPDFPSKVTKEVLKTPNFWKNLLSLNKNNKDDQN